MDRSEIGIVIPVFNESTTIGSIIKKCKNYGKIIVVDDGSTDDSARIAKKEGAFVVLHESNYGYDEALNSGFKKAVSLDVSIIITIDGDGQHNIDLINEYTNLINQGYDVVTGIRPYQQRFSEKIFSLYTNLIYGLSDPLCGMKAYKTTVFKALGHFDSYNSIGSELVIFSIINGFNVYQIEINIKERSGESRFGQIIKGNYKIFKAIFSTVLYQKKFLKNRL